MKKQPTDSRAVVSPKLRILCLFRSLGLSIREAAEAAHYASVQSAHASLRSPAGRAELARLQSEIEGKYIKIAVIGDLQKAGMLPRPCTRGETCMNYRPKPQDTPADLGA